MAGGEIDLFGDPLVPLRDRRGRKSFKKDKQNQDFVMVRIAAGWSQKRIAENMGIDEKTLRKYFSRELEFGATFVDGVMLDVLMRKVREGHTPSIRQLQERIKDAAPAAPRRSPQLDDEDEDGTPAARLGKKELERAAAQEVPDNYGDIFDRLRNRGAH
ncbi:hypothetical protein [Paracoccus sp. (in: a-proteobacteria)]|uniref:hypothetical protein n=1 Tax=Paracoccus sp. TaxID=267 RepID=UPI00289A33EE|nr:hypothetical protein [Paracoccus sp. (in: a-proteobacteria)]